MLPRLFEDMGIPSGYGVQKLLFCPIGSALVLQTCSATESWRPERLYFRHTLWDRYRPIGVPDDLVSQESPFVHSSEPLLAYVSHQHNFSVDEEGREHHSGNWHSLQIVSLENGSGVQSANEENLRVPPGTRRGWVCEILAFGDSGLFVKAALSKNESLIEYFIAQLDATNSLKTIASLPAVFM